MGLEIPLRYPRSDYPFIYDIRFELEQIVEHGGPIVDGNIADGMRETGNYNGTVGMDEVVPSSQAELEPADGKRTKGQNATVSGRWF